MIHYVHEVGGDQTFKLNGVTTECNICNAMADQTQSLLFHCIVTKRDNHSQCSYVDAMENSYFDKCSLLQW